MAKTSWRGGDPIDETLRERLRGVVLERGESGAADFFGVGKSAVMRAAMGLGVRRGTALVIKTRLEELEKAA
jgi:hypothetical protein